MCLWAVLNPSQKNLNSEADISAYDFEDYRLFIISNDKLYILKEKSTEWFFFFKKDSTNKAQNYDEESSDEEAEDQDVADKKKLSKEKELQEIENQKIFQMEAAKKAQNVIFNENEVFNLQNTKSIAFDQGPTLLITLKAEM